MTNDTRLTTDPVAQALIAAIRGGDVADLARLLAADPQLVRTRLVDEKGVARSLLHVATDWPGHFPNVTATIEILAAAGADVDARMAPHPKDPNCVETPMHWAASSDDVAAIDALLDAGADIEATGAIFTGGTPLSDAVIFANWAAARRLVARGAKPTWTQAAALGILDLVEARFAEDPAPAKEESTRALWHACRAGQKATAAFLLARGADPHWIWWDDTTALRSAEHAGHAELVAWILSKEDVAHR